MTALVKTAAPTIAAAVDAAARRLAAAGIPQPRFEARVLIAHALSAGQSDIIGHPDRCPHADAGIHGGKRRQKTQGVTADIPGNKDFQSVKIVKKAAVRTAGTHIGRPHR